MNRRRFFGAAAGAAMAPTLTETGSKLGMGGMPVGGGYPGQPVPIDYATWAAKRKRDLMALISGNLSDNDREYLEEAERHYRDQAAICNIDALRSVAAPHKRLMLAKHMRRQQESDLVSRAKRELRNLLSEG